MAGEGTTITTTTTNRYKLHSPSSALPPHKSHPTAPTLHRFDKRLFLAAGGNHSLLPPTSCSLSLSIEFNLLNKYIHKTQKPYVAGMRPLLLPMAHCAQLTLRDLVSLPNDAESRTVRHTSVERDVLLCVDWSVTALVKYRPRQQSYFTGLKSHHPPAIKGTNAVFNKNRLQKKEKEEKKNTDISTVFQVYCNVHR